MSARAPAIESARARARALALVPRGRAFARNAARAARLAMPALFFVAIARTPAAAGTSVDGAASIAFDAIEIVFEKNGSITVDHTLTVRPPPVGVVTFSGLERENMSVAAFKTSVVRDGIEAPLPLARDEHRAAVASFETVSDSRLRLLQCPRVEPEALIVCRRLERHESSLTLGAVLFDHDVAADSVVVTARARDGAAMRWLLVGAEGVAGAPRGEAAGETSVVWVSGARDGFVREPLAPIDVFCALYFVATDAGGKKRAPFGSWESLGHWWMDLVADRIDRDRGSRAAQNGAAAVPGALARASDRVYESMQSKFRYVAIELGIGGWVPDRARDVIKRGYGDCKELSGAMVSVLAAEGVPARLALVRAGPRAPLDEAFASPAWFNHVIVAVPDERGAYRFYDPTDSAARAGYLPWQDFGSPVLVVGGDKGGELIALPADARESTSVSIEIDWRIESGEATRVTARARATGYEAQRARAHIESAAAAQTRDEAARFRASWIDEAFAERSELVSARPPVVDADSIVVAAEYALRRGARVLADGRVVIGTPALPSGGHLDGLESPSPRTQPIRLAFPIAIHQRVRIHAPPGAVIESGVDSIDVAHDGYRFSQIASADSSGVWTIAREFALDRTWFDTGDAAVLARDWAEIVKATSTPVVARVPAR